VVYLVHDVFHLLLYVYFIRNMVVTLNSAQVEEEPIIADPPQGMPNTRGKRVKTVAQKSKFVIKHVMLISIICDVFLTIL
jgi:hypothetical protein